MGWDNIPRVSICNWEKRSSVTGQVQRTRLSKVGEDQSRDASDGRTTVLRAIQKAIQAKKMAPTTSNV